MLHGDVDLTPVSIPPVDLNGFWSHLLANYQLFLDWQFEVPPLSTPVVGMPLWSVVPLLLTIGTMICLISFLPWRSEDLTNPVMIRRRHNDAIAAMTCAGLLCTVGMAETFIALGSALGH